MKPLVPDRGSGTLVQVIETLLDRGLVLNADIMVSVAGVELLGIRIRAALASFETAARYGLEFPGGTESLNPAWRAAQADTEACPACNKRSPREALLDHMCPWCGWKSARAKLGEARGAPLALPPTHARPNTANAVEASKRARPRRAAKASPSRPLEATKKGRRNGA